MPSILLIIKIKSGINRDPGFRAILAFEPGISSYKWLFLSKHFILLNSIFVSKDYEPTFANLIISRLMKNKLLVLVLLLVCAIHVRAQWIPVSGIEGADCYNITHVGSSWFMYCTGIGIVKQNDDSTSWSTSYPHQISELFKIGNVLIASRNYSNKLSRSFDEGVSWDTTLKVDTFHFQQFAATDTALFSFSTNHHSICKSGDYGQTWEVLFALDENQYYGLFSDDRNLYFTTNEEPWILYTYSNESNATDTIAYPPQVNTYGGIKDIQRFDNSLFFVSDSLYRYSYLLKQWFTSYNEHKIVSFTVHNNELFGCGDGVFKYLPANDNWMHCDSGIAIKPIKNMTFGNGKASCINSMGCYSTDSTFIWEDNKSGLNAAGINYLAAKGNEVWACTSYGLYKSIDGGFSFTQKSNLGVINYRKLLLTDTAYYLTSDYRLLISNDFGGTWITHSLDFLTQYDYISDFDIGSQYIFALIPGSTGNKLYRTKYSPILWEAIDGSDITYAHYIAVHDTTVMISVFSSNMVANPVYISFNNGESLVPAPFIQDTYDVSLKFENGNFIALCNNWYFKSHDGLNWGSHVVNNPNYIVLSDLSEVSGNTVAVGWYYSGMPLGSLSHDEGSTWNNITANLNGPLVWALTHSAILGNRVFAGTMSKGLWYRDDLITTKLEQANPDTMPVQVLPNPAKESFDIQINIPKSGFYNLSVIDVQGRIVLNKEHLLLKTGFNQYQVNSANLKNGMYLARLSDTKTITTTKLIIAK